MPMVLNEVQIRVLAALVEKQLTTPEYYPLTVNALVQACNQKTNRDPIVSFDETTINKAIDSLREKNLVYVFHGAGSRTLKYKHLLPEVYELNPEETAVLCVLMMRGAQTLGEIRERSSRMYEFPTLSETEETLSNLSSRDSQPLVIKLPRQPNQKEVRYTHLLAGEPILLEITESNSSRSTSSERITELEQKVETLTVEINTLKATFEDFRKQFE